MYFATHKSTDEVTTQQLVSCFVCLVLFTSCATLSCLNAEHKYAQSTNSGPSQVGPYVYQIYLSDLQIVLQLLDVLLESVYASVVQFLKDEFVDSPGPRCPG